MPSGASRVRSSIGGKAKAKAKAKQAVRVPKWEYQEVEAVYISKVHKTPAKFLNLTDDSVECWEIDFDLIENCKPAVEDGETYPILRLLLKKPVSPSSRRIFDGNDATAFVHKVLGADGVIAHDRLVRKCRKLQYPLFG